MSGICAPCREFDSQSERNVKAPRTTARMKLVNADRFPDSPLRPYLARQMLNAYQDRSLAPSEAQMRSDLVFGATKQVSNRFLLVRVLAKASRDLHRPGARIEDTTNDVLTRCGCINPIADENAIRIPTTAESRRSRAHDAVVHRAGTFAVLPVGNGSQAPSERSRVLVA